MKIALLGSHPASTKLAPFDDRTFAQYQAGKVQAYPQPQFPGDIWRIWGCSPAAFATAPKSDAWFEVHRWEPGQAWFSPEYCQFLRDYRGPVYTGGPIPEIQRHVVYPTKHIESVFSAFFLTSSISLMAALAIRTIEEVRAWRQYHRTPPDQRTGPEPLAHLQAFGIPMEWLNTEEMASKDEDDIIGFWGIDMSAEEEYSRQKPGAWFFGLEALRRGIGIFYPPESDLFRPEPIYGLSEWDHDYIQATARMRMHNLKLQQIRGQLEQLNAELLGYQGAKAELGYEIKTWKSPFGLPPGVVIRQLAGTGLGTSVGEVDGVRIGET